MRYIAHWAHRRHHDSARRPDTRIRLHRMALWVVPAKLAVVALLLVLPSGLAIGLGAAHGVAVLIAGVVALALMMARRGRRRPAVSHHPYMATETSTDRIDNGESREP